MKRSLHVVLGAAAVTAVAVSPAAAQDAGTGPYLSIGGAYVMPTDSDLDRSGSPLDGEVEWDNGWGVLGAGGYDFGDFRSELEVGWRHSDADSLSLGAMKFDAAGSVNAVSAMANVIYEPDFNIGGLKPYVGAGLGVARIEMEDLATAGGTIIDDEGDMSWAWQGIAGVAYGITSNIDLTLDYRYFSAPDVELESMGTTYDTDYASHNVMLGVRYTFNAPPPPPPAVTPAPEPQPEPVAQPAQPRDYLVFFEFDSAQLTPEARQVLDQAAAAASNMQPTTVNVTGHADRSGPTDYNERLSMRRADAVANYMAQQGVAMQRMMLEAEGETMPLVPTADGVREPQNRRVMIKIQP